MCTFFHSRSRTLPTLPKGLIALLLAAAPSLAQQYLISTFAGGGPFASPIGATDQHLVDPSQLTTDSAGNLYLTAQSCCVYRIDPTGSMTRVAGTGRIGYSGDGGSALDATLNSPLGLVIDSAGNLFIADSGNYRIRKVSTDGIISTVAGVGNSFSSLGDGGPAVNAGVTLPRGVVIGADGSLYILERYLLRKVTPDGIITTIAGNGTYGYDGDGGVATGATFASPGGLAIDAAGNLYINDCNNFRIRRITTSGVITTIGGTGQFGYSGDGGPAIQARIGISSYSGIAVDRSGNIFFSDNLNNRIREITPDGVIQTVAGNGWGPLTTGFTNNPAVSPLGLTLNKDGILYFVDTVNLRIRTGTGNNISVVAGTDVPLPSIPGFLAIQAPINTPRALVADASGTLYIADTEFNIVAAVTRGGNISIFAGNTQPADSGDGGPASLAGIKHPGGLNVDPAGNLYIVENDNAVVRKVTPSGIISTLAGPGSGLPVLTGGIIVDSTGAVYVSSNCTVQKISGAGKVSLFAGTGTCSFSGDGGLATAAQLNLPLDLAVDAQDNIYIADSQNFRVRKVSTAGKISTVAGGGYNTGANSLVFSGSSALDIQLSAVEGVIFDAAGNMYVSDQVHVIKVAPDNSYRAIAGTTGAGDNGDGGPADKAVVQPADLAIDGSTIYLAEVAARVVRALKPVQNSVGITSILNAASEAGGPLSPGEIAVVYGFGFAQLGSLTAPTLNIQTPSGGFFGTQLGNAIVRFNGIAAPVLYTTPWQLSAIVPYGSPVTGSITVTVEYQGQVSDPFPMIAAPVTPGVFSVNQTGSGQAVAVHSNGSINSASNPARMGDYLILYLTGEGQLSPGGVDGKIATLPLPAPLQPVTVTIGGKPATVTYVGSGPGQVEGLTQVNVQIPAGIQPGGYVPLSVQMGGQVAQGGLTIAVTNK